MDFIPTDKRDFRTTNADTAQMRPVLAWRERRQTFPQAGETDQSQAMSNMKNEAVDAAQAVLSQTACCAAYNWAIAPGTRLAWRSPAPVHEPESR